MLVRLKDIAEKLNISVSTVSRVVNNKDKVDPLTKDRILKALIEFNYQPSEIARGLRGSKTNVIGIIVPDIANIFYAKIIKSIESVARKSNFSVILSNSENDIDIENECIKTFAQYKVAGLIIASINCSGNTIKKYFLHHEPIVYIDNYPKTDEYYNSVIIDNIKASYKIVKHLIDHGHKKIFMIPGSLKGNQTVDTERYQGWKNALADHSIMAGKSWIAEGDMSFESGYKIMKGFLKLRNLPTAVFAANNLMAFGAVKAINECGLTIPGDVSIVAFDAIDTTEMMKLQITSMIQPAQNIGIHAAEICIKEIHSKDHQAYNRVILEYNFVEGNSVSSI